ncbi:MAG TPA: hypothetical protein VJW20_01740 [Candidatus Angelobacter sp.]|nr:hypothetical protein [Candidatus Angelobacter sp.]
MKAAYFLFLATMELILVSCIHTNPEVTSQDCTVAATPAGFTRIFIGTPAPGGKQSGTSFDDPLDGSSADKFDTILRTISEGQQPTWGTQANIPPQNLIVCLASGTFQTRGQYDWEFGKGHSMGQPLGFTVEKNWKIHGRGTGHTTLQLASYVPDQFPDVNGVSFDVGRNVVIGTHSKNASNVEISDLTIDANHDHLTAPGGLPLNLEGIVLRSDQGGHWIHDVNVIGGSGDAGAINVSFETFTVRIWGNNNQQDPQENSGNIIERVTVTKPGQAMLSHTPPGGACDGIAVNNVVAEIKNNLVDGYGIAYGGWSMGPVSFHDNVSHNTIYGFNADSFSNNGVKIESNKFIQPSSYGIVIGGGGLTMGFNEGTVANNTIELSKEGSIGLVLRGQVNNATLSNNTIFSLGSARNKMAIWSYLSIPGAVNLNNAFENNHIDKALTMDFSQDPNFNTDCRFQNRDLQGEAIPGFPDNSAATCQ